MHVLFKKVCLVILIKLRINVFFQLRRHLSLLKNSTTLSAIEQVQQKWRLFCKEPPKGFEKFFKAGLHLLAIFIHLFFYSYGKLYRNFYRNYVTGEGKNGKNAPKKAEETSKKAEETSKKADTKKPLSSSTSSSSSGSKSGFEWTFKMGSSQGGKSLEGGDKEKTYMILVALGISGVIGLLLAQDFNLKEITWREFIYK